MTKIIYRREGGDETVLDAEDGDSVMFAAVQNGVDGIAGECGGVLSCATCHVYVDENWIEAVGEAADDEKDMLDVTNAERRPNSRLSCQIEIRPDLDGIIINIPEEQ